MEHLDGDKLFYGVNPDSIIKITDTYKAAYFLTQGAKLIEISFERVESKKSLYATRWICHLTNVSQETMLNWNSGNAIVNVVDFRRERLRIKKIAKRKML